MGGASHMHSVLTHDYLSAASSCLQSAKYNSVSENVKNAE